MEQEYFDFLLSFLDESDGELPSIFDSHHLLWKLHHIEFRYSAMMDRNRDMDGREWRQALTGISKESCQCARGTPRAC